MDNNKKSLVTKIIEKGIITPYEAVHLQHLNTKNARDQLKNMDLSGNFYLKAEQISELVPPSLLKQVLTFKNIPDGQLYDAYQWTGNDLANQEAHIGEIGYKGLALLNEIRYMRSENSLRVIVDMHSKRPVVSDLFNYRTYSRVNQRSMTLNDTFGVFGTIFRILIATIDIVLTENYYLQNIFELEELDCLKYLKMWLRQESSEKDIDEEEPMTPLFNVTQTCCKEFLDIILDEHHQMFTEMMRAKIDSFGIGLTSDFEERSLEYVKKTIKNIVNSVSNSQTTHLQEL